MSYTHTSIAALATQLGNRLGNTIFWTSDERIAYIKESIRTFNSIAQSYRERCTFNTQSGIAFYDLTETSNPNAFTGGTGNGATNPPNLIGYTLQDRDLVNAIQYHLIETLTSNWALPWPGTDQFILDDLTKSIERRRNQFLLECGTHLIHSQTVYNPPPSNGRISLSDLIIQVRRIAWKDLDLTYDCLDHIDEWEANTYFPNWETNTGIPRAFATTLTPPISVQIFPASDDIGTLDIISINNSTDLNPTAGILLNIPDDFSWIIKFGALADLLGKDSQAYDPIRSQYCEERYKQGIQIANASGLINQVAINGVYITPQSISDLDSYKPGWQNVSGQPKQLAICGRNLVALSPVPDGSYSIQLDLIRNIPVSSDVQVGKEDLDIILDYAFHLAMFKCQGLEFEGTYPHLNRFMKQAMLHNDKLKAEAPNYDIMNRLSIKETIDKRRFADEEE
jgi:hypothetical protein